MIAIHWQEWLEHALTGRMAWRAIVPAWDHAFELQGEIEITIIPRPLYCDRGDYLVSVFTQRVIIDLQEGFPRYLFGDADLAKAQMHAWVNKREACLRWAREIGAKQAAIVPVRILSAKEEEERQCAAAALNEWFQTPKGQAFLARERKRKQ